MLKDVLYLFIILAGIPAALWLMRAADEEVKEWKGRLSMIAIISGVGAPLVYFLRIEYSEPIIVGLLFIIIVCMTIIRRTK
jgi:hypothetical protein